MSVKGTGHKHAGKKQSHMSTPLAPTATLNFPIGLAGRGVTQVMRKFGCTCCGCPHFRLSFIGASHAAKRERQKVE
eukprot:1154747-Pelagomonas_calceolata.AAC.10